MRIYLALFIAFCLLQIVGACKPMPRKGDVLYQTDFEGPDALKGWSGAGKLGPGFESDQSLFIERPAGSPVGSTVAVRPNPVENVRGYLLYFSAMIKAENVSAKPQSWNGIKFMAPITTPGAKLHPQGTIGVGTFDWKRVIFPLRIPKDATQMSLYLGLEAVTGKVWFDDIKITVHKPPFVVKPRAVSGPIYKGHDLPRLRGTMISPNVDEESLRVLGKEWNANVVRWQLVGWRPKGDQLDLAAYDRWLDGQLQKLDAGLPLCEKYGLMVVVDLHGAPSGGPDSGKNLFSDGSCQRKFIEVWERLARKYKDAKPVWGYDLVNEPTEGCVAEGLDDWQALAERAAKAIRAIDPKTAIIVEPAQGGNPYGLEELQPIDVSNVVYSVHMYLPHAFTHQGVFGNWTKQFRYPGEIDGKMWDKAQLELALKPVVDFQKNYGVHIYIGEFSAIRWAPDNSAYRYLKDLIDIFEAHDWDWTYHAFREWSGWSVEHGPDRKDTKPVAQPTDRQKLLCEWFAKNKKPSWYKSQ
jgi:hypothetical protein